MRLRLPAGDEVGMVCPAGCSVLEAARLSAGGVSPGGGIRFVDDTTIRITEHSMVVIDEFVFDPNPDNSKLALNFVKGTARFTSSLTNAISKKNIKLKTNSAVVGIRGTDFTITVEPDTGKSLFILLPDENGNPSGEISVTTAIGTVILNKPYQILNIDSYTMSSYFQDRIHSWVHRYISRTY